MDLRNSLEILLKRRFFISQSFEIYGPTAGLYDYGPPGTAMLKNFEQIWREHFVLAEEMHELDLPVLTPYNVLKTSGHVDRFCDYMVSDLVTGNIIRADHLIKEVLTLRIKNGEDLESTLSKLDSLSGEELGELITKLDIKSDMGNSVSMPVEFNLMFSTNIGPRADAKCFLRPETAQGQFVNFNKLLEFNGGRMPFASASIGRSYRNEISPRSGLLRVREFQMAEIEHFVDPNNKAHVNFHTIKSLAVKLLPANVQMAGSTETITTTIEEAVKSKTIDNETLGYFIGRVHLFLLKIGICASKMRFRQHMKTEMAHYACDCWDAELLCSYGWIECVGIADRSAYDLTRHGEATGQKLVVREPLETPLKSLKLSINRKVFGPKYKQKSEEIKEKLALLPQSELEILQKSQTYNLDGLEIDRNDVFIEQVVENVREYVPNVVEPSFGIGRIIYCLLEQSLYVRNPESDETKRTVLKLTPMIAPYKLLVVPLSNQRELIQMARDLVKTARAAGLATRCDDTGASVGKRYSRNDELGIPFGATIDFQSINDMTCTLRERDSMQQKRVRITDVVSVVAALVAGMQFDQIKV